MDRLRFDGVVVVPLVLLGVSRVKMLAMILGCSGNRREGSAYKKSGLSYVGDGRNRRRVGKKGIKKEKDHLLQTLGVDIHCGTYGGGPHRCPRWMQSTMDGEGGSGMEGAYGA
jgi:hypothetical protein